MARNSLDVEIALFGNRLSGNKREVFLMALALAGAFLFIFACLMLVFSGSISHALVSTGGQSSMQMFINIVSLVLVSALFVFYRRWKASEFKKQEFEDVIQSINPYAIVVVDSSARIVMCNRATIALFGYGMDEMIQSSLSLLLNEAHSTDNLAEIFDRVALSGSYMGETTGKRKDGGAVSIEIIGAALRENDGVVLLFRDITEQRRNNDKLLIMQKAIENTQIGVTITDKKGSILYTNPADAAMHGYTLEELVGKDVRIFAVAKDHNPMSEEKLKSLKRFRRESVNVRKDGRTFPVQLMSDIVTNNEGEVIALITTCEDITDRKNNEEIIRQFAYYDILTGLPNRKLFQDLMKKELAKARRNKESLAVMFVDLDRFKVINDTLGHSTGDELLKAIARRLTHTVRESDIVCRFGGDEFIVLIPDIVHPRNAATVAGKINRTFSEVFMVGNNEIYITASVGISVFPYNGYEMETLIKNADCAMYQAKKQEKNTYQFYDPSIEAGAMEKFSLERNLRKALKHEEFLLHYQPLVDLPTGNVVGAEALLRWGNNPDSISPKQVISLAEETDLIMPLGEWILRTACEQIVIWQEKGLQSKRLSVNVSMLQFKRKNFPVTLRKIVEETGINPANLELELTESILMHDIDYTSSTLAELKCLGISLSIDDFGTGYSSLSYLKHLPLDRLKIDQSFIGALTTSPNDYAICKAIVVMAHSLDLKVVAEGIEHNSQLAILRTMHCDEAQGFFFSRPLPEKELLDHMLMDRDAALLPTSPIRPHAFAFRETPSSDIS